jgi:hypothetical protein
VHDSLLALLLLILRTTVTARARTDVVGDVTAEASFSTCPEDVVSIHYWCTTGQYITAEMALQGREPTHACRPLVSSGPEVEFHFSPPTSPVETVPHRNTAGSPSLLRIHQQEYMQSRVSTPDSQHQSLSHGTAPFTHATRLVSTVIVPRHPDPSVSLGQSCLVEHELSNTSRLVRVC